MLKGSILKHQWPTFMKEIYRIVKPGIGWVQCVEVVPQFRCDDGSYPDDGILYKVLTLDLIYMLIASIISHSDKHSTKKQSDAGPTNTLKKRYLMQGL